MVDLETTLANVAAMLKPGGHFLMLEPNSRHLLEGVRRLWYRLDASFDHATEHALDHEALVAAGRGAFEVERVRYFGGPAYFLILNSMILRVPLGAKPWLAPPATLAERLWNHLPGAHWHNVFLARWRRRI